MKYIFISIAVVLVLGSCSTAPQQRQIQTAIAQTQTPTPTYAIQITETLEPTQGSINEAQDIHKDPEIQYVINIGNKITAISQALNEISHLSLNPKIGDEQSLRDLAVQRETIQLSHQELTELEVPIGFKEAHSELLDATGDCKKAMDYYDSVFDYGDLDDIELANEYMIQCLENFPSPSSFFGTYLNEFEQPSQFSNNTPLAIFTSTPVPTIEIIPTATYFPVGSPFVINNWQIQVVKVELLEEIPFYNKINVADGRFALLFMSVTNTGNKKDSFVSPHGKLDIVDSEFNRFEEDTVASFEAEVMYNQEPGESLDIAPGETRSLIFVYDISDQSEYYLLVPGILIENFRGKVLLEIP